jgi:Late competence development protein ComFB
MRAYNIMEEIVEEYLKEMISSDRKICGCEICHDKIKAEVLSSIPAKYVTSETGAMYTMIEQVRVEQSSVILRELVKAIKNLKPHAKP